MLEINEKPLFKNETQFSGFDQKIMNQSGFYESESDLQ